MIVKYVVSTAVNLLVEIVLMSIEEDIDAQNAKKKQTIDLVLNKKASRRRIITNI